MHGEHGRFRTRYIVRGVYASGFCAGGAVDFSLQLSGGCIHKVRGKSGAFDELDGVFRVYDVVPGITAGGVGMPDPAGFGASNFLYEGVLEEDD